MADGPPGQGTVLTLSHWPHSPTPRRLARDLSAQIALDYLRSARRLDAESVTNDHLDQDGLVAVFVLTQPEEALRAADLLVEVASAGDFAVFSEREAARVSFALAALCDPERSPAPLPPGDGPPETYEERTSALYGELLERLPALLSDTGAHRHLWAPEDDAYSRSLADLAASRIRVHDCPSHDLAVACVDEEVSTGLCTRFVHPVSGPVHPAVIYNASPRHRVVISQGRRHELRYRYESWVRLVSRRPAARVDLAPLAERLDALEPHGPRWVADAVGALEPVLRLAPGQESGLDLGRFVGEVTDHLGSAPPAWLPWGDDTLGR